MESYGARMAYEKKHYDNMDVERVWTQSAEWSSGNHGNTFGQRGSNMFQPGWTDSDSFHP